MTPENQSLSALVLANATRARRVQIRHQIVDGTLTMPEALEDPVMGRVRVVDLLAWQHRWGVVRADRLMRIAGISPRLYVRDLTERQHHALLHALTHEQWAQVA